MDRPKVQASRPLSDGTRGNPSKPLAPMGTAKADDGTHLTACTQPPRRHRDNPHPGRAVAVHSLHLRRCYTIKGLRSLQRWS